MNYAGHEKLRAEVAEVANSMCDLRATLNGWSTAIALTLMCWSNA